MPPHSEDFPWPNYYGNFDFFEQKMREHSAVSSISKIDDGLYEIVRYRADRIKVFVCDCYSFGVAEYRETLQNHSDIDAIIICSMWCGYNQDAKEMAALGRKGLFKVAEFMGAINKNELWNYSAPSR